MQGVFGFFFSTFCMTILPVIRRGKLLLLLSLLPLGVMGQDPAFINYSVEEGLIGANAYHVMQDSKGYIWIATQNGVSRFDGYEFENFTETEGLPGNEVFRIHEDSRGRIWFLTYNGSPGYYLNGKFHNPRNDSVMAAGNAESFLTGFLEDSDGNIWIGTFGKECFRFGADGSVEKITTCGKESIQRIAFLYEGRQKEVYAVLGSQRFLNLKNCTTFQPEDNTRSGRYMLYGRASKPGENDTLLCGSWKSQIRLIVGEQQFPVPAFPNDYGQINQLVKGNDGRVYVSTSDGVVMMEGHLTGNVKVSSFFKGQNISSVFEDHEGDLWVSTLGEGVYHIPGMGVKRWSFVQGNKKSEVMGVGKDREGRIWVGLTRGKLGFLKDGAFYPKDELTFFVRSRAVCKDILLHSSGEIWISMEERLYVVDGDKVYTFFFNCKRLNEELDGSVLISNYSGVLRAKNKEALKPYATKFTNWTDSLLLQRRCEVALTDSRERLFVGRHSGLFLYHPDGTPRENTFLGRHPIADYQVNDMAETRTGIVAVATQGMGLVVIRDTNISVIDQTHGLSSDVCKKLFVDAQDRIWVGTSHGISRVTLQTSGQFSLRTYGKAEGIISGEINDIYVDRDTIWAATSDGLFRMVDSPPETGSTLPLYIHKFIVNGTAFPIERECQFSHNENHIQISYTGLHFRDPGAITYRYKMVGADTSWHYTKQRVVEYPLMPSGTYRFELEASIDGEFWVSEGDGVSFHISRPFWRSVWFLVSIIIGVALLAGMFIWLRVRFIRKQHQLRERVMEYRQMALRAQMNPHFVFNCLNSIQQFIAVGNQEQALVYLSKFSKLIRLVLEHSGKSLVSLEDELEALKFYMELESLRVRGKFDYKIVVDPSIDTDMTNIPAMILQPFVENAIWHGVMNRDDGGIVRVSISAKEGGILMIVEDNGVGRETAGMLNEWRKRTHKSVGIAMTKSRIELISGAKKKGVSFIKIEDLRDDNGNAAGTRVRIFIPEDL